jgi:hypothetical protein
VAPVAHVQANERTPTGVASRTHRQVVNVQVLESRVELSEYGTAAPEHKHAEGGVPSRLSWYSNARVPHEPRCMPPLQRLLYQRVKGSASAPGHGAGQFGVDDNTVRLWAGALVAKRSVSAW